jgi:hypothetical protein
VDKDGKEMEVGSFFKKKKHGGRIKSDGLEFAVLQTFKQAAKFAPDDIPTSRPSSLANLLAFAIASSAVTVMISSISEMSRFLGTNPGPTP